MIRENSAHAPKSGKPLAKAPGVKLLRMGGDRAALEVEEGRYEFGTTTKQRLYSGLRAICIHVAGTAMKSVRARIGFAAGYNTEYEDFDRLDVVRFDCYRDDV